MQELRQLREKLAAAEKKAAEAVEAAAAQQQPAPAPAATTSPQELAAVAQKLAAAEARAAVLERELHDVRNATPAAAKGNAESFRAFVEALQRDLQSKVGDLLLLVEKDLPSANIQETTVKRLRLPEEIASAFNSAVIFSVADAAGQVRRLEFPVQAGLDGQWRMPTLADLRKHLIADAPLVEKPAVPPTPPGQPAGTIIVIWGDAPRHAPTPPSSPPLPLPTTAAAKPAPAAPTVPKLVMPVQQDVKVRFE